MQNRVHQCPLVDRTSASSHLKRGPRRKRNQLDESLPKLLVIFLLADLQMLHGKSCVVHSLNGCGVRHAKLSNILVCNADIGAYVDNLKEVIALIDTESSSFSDHAPGNQCLAKADFIRDQDPILSVLEEMVDSLHRHALKVLQDIHRGLFCFIHIELCHIRLRNVSYLSRNVVRKVSYSSRNSSGITFRSWTIFRRYSISFSFSGSSEAVLSIFSYKAGIL